MMAVIAMTLRKPASSSASPRWVVWANGPKPRALPESVSVPSTTMTAVTPGWPKRNALQTMIGNVTYATGSTTFGGHADCANTMVPVMKAAVSSPANSRRRQFGENRTRVLPQTSSGGATVSIPSTSPTKNVSQARP